MLTFYVKNIFIDERLLTKILIQNISGTHMSFEFKSVQ